MARSLRFTLVASAAVAILAAASSDVSAQAATFRACRVPGVGAIYMIGIEGLPESCLAEHHVEFSWTEGRAPADGSITEAKLADEAVTTAKLSAGAVTSAALADDAVTGAKIADGSVGGDQLADGSVTEAKLAADLTIQVQSGSIGTVELADDAVTSAKISDGAVGTIDLLDGAVTAAKLDFDAVTGATVADGTLTGSDLADGSVTVSQIGIGAVGTAQVLNGSIENIDLAPNSVDAEQLMDGSVGGSELNLQIVSATTSTRTDDFISAAATCPGSSTPFSGGFTWNNLQFVQTTATLFENRPFNNTWTVTFHDPAPYAILSLTAFAICIGT